MKIGGKGLCLGIKDAGGKRENKSSWMSMGDTCGRANFPLGG